MFEFEFEFEFVNTKTYLASYQNIYPLNVFNRFLAINYFTKHSVSDT